MAFIFFIVNLFMCIGCFWLYRYLYGGKEKVQKVKKESITKQIMLGLLDAMKEQHLDGRKK